MATLTGDAYHLQPHRDMTQDPLTILSASFYPDRPKSSFGVSPVNLAGGGKAQNSSESLSGS